ncbi:hypothetical protein BC629DRAFT_1738556 [Irpex lacteus]|nr:hypothetical protein BC629DRAFT_1738556 [Irpex lacteus]
MSLRHWRTIRFVEVITPVAREGHNLSLQGRHSPSRDTTYEPGFPVPKVVRSPRGPAYEHSLPVPKAVILVTVDCGGGGTGGRLGNSSLFIRPPLPVQPLPRLRLHISTPRDRESSSSHPPSLWNVSSIFWSSPASIARQVRPPLRPALTSNFSEVPHHLRRYGSSSREQGLVVDGEADWVEPPTHFLVPRFLDLTFLRLAEVVWGVV